MQSLSWYVRRLRSMSLPEIWWRVGSKVQAAVDRRRVSSLQGAVDLRRIANVNGGPGHPGTCAGRELSTSPGESPSWPEIEMWRRRLAGRADLICANRLTLFDLHNHDLGERINWNYEYKADIPTPIRHASSIDYRDHSETGDCKFAWEPSRHQHLVVLGRAYRLTGEARYAQAVVDHIDSWIEQCPYGMGMQWRSPLELGIRLINWARALTLIEPAGVMNEAISERVIGSAYLHIRDITRHYSRYSSANNHLIGEAAGVYVGASCFGMLMEAERRRRESRAILEDQVDAQTYADGGNREQAFGYLLFVLEFFIEAGVTARRMGEDFSERYWSCVEKMLRFVCAFYEGGERPVMFGDADDGYVLDLEGESDRGRELLAVGSAMFNNEEFGGVAGRQAGERVFWQLGQDAYERYRASDDRHARPCLASRALPDSGYYLLQTGAIGDDPEDARISVSFDCGELGFGSIAAHGHADALSITLRAFGQDVLVDPGTYDYFTYRAWRDYFKSTRAHNTIVVDGEDQSEMLGLFLWGKRANAKCLEWSPGPEGGRVAGEHDGYRRLPGGVIHQRSVELDGAASRVVIRDRLAGAGSHHAALHLHFAETCTVERSERGGFSAVFPGGFADIDMDDRMSVEAVVGSEDPILGWVSRGYHRKEPSPTLRATCGWEGTLAITTTIRLRRHVD